MFGGELSEKKVKVLSGGERSRLAMIKLLLEPVNLLILDEPTNHLDMMSKDVLKDAIKAFDGTAIIVSHDREFLDGLVDKVYEFAAGHVREHLGGIYDYLRGHNTIDDKLQAAYAQQPKEAEQHPDKSTARQDYDARKDDQKKLRKARKALEDCEKRIASMEERIAELDSLLMLPENASDMTLVTEYTSIKKKLDEENERWFEMAEGME